MPIHRCRVQVRILGVERSWPNRGPGLVSGIWLHSLTVTITQTRQEIPVFRICIEFAAGAAGAAKQGASRRAVVLAAVGAIAGSFGGAAVCSAIPVIGTIIGALGGGAFGAFGGAYLGEVWKGKSSDERLKIGKAALVGRLLGTLGKLSVGAVMVVIVTIGSFF